MQVEHTGQMITEALLDGVLYSDRLLRGEIHAGLVVTETRQRLAYVPAATAAHDPCVTAELQQLMKLAQHMIVMCSR